MADPTLEEQLRETIRESIVLVENFAPLCKTPDDLVGMLRLALTNDGQLSMIMHKLTPLSKRIS